MAPPSSSSPSSSGGSSRRRSAGSSSSSSSSSTPRFLTPKDEDRLGKLVTSKAAFASKIQQGRGAMVCLFLELKDVNGGEKPYESMDIEAHPLLPSRQRASIDNERVKLTFDGTIVSDFRDFLYEHSTTLDAATPIRCLVSGYGARVTAKNKTIMYDRDELVVKLWTPAVEVKPVKGRKAALASESQPQSQSQASQGEGEHLWFDRYRREELQDTQADPVDPPLSEPVQSTQAINPLVEDQHSHATDSAAIAPATAPQTHTQTQTQESQASSPPRWNSSPPRWNSSPSHGADENALGPLLSLASSSSHEGPSQDQPAKDDVPAPASSDQPAGPSSDEASAPTPVSQPAPPAPPAQPTTSTQPDVANLATQTAAASIAAHSPSKTAEDDVILVPSATPSSPPKSNGEDWFNTPQKKERAFAPRSASAHDDDSNAPDEAALLAEAEASQSQAGPSAQAFQPRAPTLGSWPVASRPASRRITPSSLTSITLLDDCRLDSKRTYKFLGVIHTCQSPRRTNGYNKNLSMHVVLVDKSGYLKTMFFSSGPEEIDEFAQGVTVLIEPVSLQEWPGAKNPRQGKAEQGVWRAAFMPAPQPEEPLDSGAVRGTLRPRDEEYERMLALRNWYHFERGNVESLRKYPTAWLRPLKTISELRGRAENGGPEFYDLLAQVVEVYEPGGPNQPATVYVTDYTYSEKVRSIYDMHLGYEESEYMPRAVKSKTKVGGGWVMGVALFSKQQHALFGISKGQFILFSGLRSRWHDEYGLSAAVGSDTDSSLKLREGADQPGMDVLLARKKEWEEKREREIKDREEREGEMEEVWEEVHGSGAMNQMPSVSIGKKEKDEVGVGGDGAEMHAAMDAQTQNGTQQEEEASHDNSLGGEYQMVEKPVGEAENGVAEHSVQSEAPREQVALEQQRADEAVQGQEQQHGEADTTMATGETDPAAVQDIPRITGGGLPASKEPNSNGGDDLDGEDSAMSNAEKGEGDQSPPQPGPETEDRAHQQQEGSHQQAVDEQQASQQPVEEQPANPPAAPIDDATDQYMAPIEDVPVEQSIASVEEAALPTNGHTNGVNAASATVVIDRTAFASVSTASSSVDADQIPSMTVAQIGELFPAAQPEFHDFKVYAMIKGAKLLDVKPREAKEWIRGGKKGKQIMMALLLAEQGEGEELGMSINPHRCLPVLLSGDAACQFFGVDARRLSEDIDYESVALAIVKKKLEGLATVQPASTVINGSNGAPHANLVNGDRHTGNTESDDDDEQAAWRRMHQLPLHDWGLSIWKGKKSGKVQVSVWGCEVKVAGSGREGEGEGEPEEAREV
ncbi:hypothetical protein BDZ90DRAFT_275347 [Jaminaea rosea]|uniref:Protection of telomeres protein 1 ssDNA-binding domain-containing protein n=1 Tax=Jaminaea rosea TaxID=1569628 RepID=A0A316UMH1_9BASI|nr:hypothetical protein BDZ90DRAFT_275347 [Jaminaea rosea]PWN26154.1 hypothetical protein BDZ90DRAFT_275347 [Jaminaea rosea]